MSRLAGTAVKGAAPSVSPYDVLRNLVPVCSAVLLTRLRGFESHEGLTLSKIAAAAVRQQRLLHVLLLCTSSTSHVLLVILRWLAHCRSTAFSIAAGTM